MKVHRYPIFLTCLTVIFILLAIAAESVYFSDFEYHFRTKMFNETLIEEETIMENCLDSIKPILANVNHAGKISEDNFIKAEQNKISLLEYVDNKLVYWSDNEFDVPSDYIDSLFNKPLIFLQNGWFLTKSIQSRNEKIIALLRLRTDYSFENSFIKSGFEKDFRIPDNVGLSLDKKASEYHIFDKEGTFLFSLSFPEVKGSTYFILVPLCFWTGAFFLIILLVFRLVKLFDNRDKSLLGIGISFIVFSFIYSFIVITGKPPAIFHTEFFSPYRFTLNGIIPSLGHLLILSVLGAAFFSILYRYLPIKEIKEGPSGKNYLILSIMLMIGAVILFFYQWIFGQLISTSNINFETYKVLGMSKYTLAGFVAIFVLILIPVFYFLKIFKIARLLSTKIVVLSIISSVIVFVLLFYKSRGFHGPIIVVYLVMTIGLWQLSGRTVRLFNLTVIFSLICGIYFLYFITILSEKKITENLKVQAVSLSTEHDPEAEHLLLDLWPVIEKDSLLSEMMKADYFDKDIFDRISNYLQETYFTGFWKDYHFSLVLCQKDQPLIIETEKYQNCFSFFNDRIMRNGRKLTGTNFYFIDNQGGRSDYLGVVYYTSLNFETNGLFIELYNDVNIFQPGYSELLVDKKYHGYTELKDYSFAKYINGELVLITGDFPFDKTDVEYIDKFADFRIFRTDGFKHVLFKNGNTTVIITRPDLTIGDIIISFAYIFAFILIASNIVVLLTRRPVMRRGNLFNFRQKLQFSYIGILLFSFILIGIVVAYITISQYRTKHYENIKEKLSSVYLDLDSKLSMEKYLSNDWKGAGYSSLNDLLIKLSNVFNTDINLYNVNGFLIATSRQEIFDRDLMSPRINNIALTHLKLSKTEYYQKEKIGTLEYLSAYVPFYNIDNKVIAYLNLPYFRMQSVLAKEISNLIVAVTNFTLLLILITMSLAVFISGRLTSPLAMLGKGLATVGVGKKSEHLTYRGNDEIGELVKQYNRMVDEIEESSHKLADSEREYAWREMAKQIAHEIKNPLTPMKLNVQQLLKSWNDKVPGFEKTIERFTKNQIEYIDNLSSIASAFSSFAKMPVTNPVEVDILDQIRITLELFKNTDHVTFRVHWPHETKIIIYADKEQLNGVFSNLIKNGIQSIPQEREGIITLSLEVRGDKVLISISDNGSGIPSALRKNLFTPNFTTKTSGMGLGLSIARKYIESANGRIWFESEVDKGSVFYFELPVKYTVEKPG
ncbi:MAG TPA: MFS domain-containing histidine kinase [Bacteroidales bacterium]|nr:MFS domain-containing histidine kinase [Bacteroidales bacterium]